MSFMGPEVIFKQLDLVKEVLPPPARALGVLFDPLNPDQVDTVAEVPVAAAAPSLKVHPIQVAASDAPDPGLVRLLDRIPPRTDARWVVVPRADWGPHADIQPAAAVGTARAVLGD